MNQRTITGGLYLVVDPAMGSDVLQKVEAALEAGVDVLQIWNHWTTGQDKNDFILKISAMAHRFDVPVLINEEWQWLNHSTLDGVHFDAPPENFSAISREIKRSFIWGMTCGNNLLNVKWAIQQKADYLSFCSLFASASASTCELVKPDTIALTRKLTSIPIFVAGGINLDNIKEVANLNVNGIAIIGGILKADDPKAAAHDFKEGLKINLTV
jgi:thiamine-phosphate pyrophosphorylase